VSDVVEHGVSGLLVERGDAAGLSAAIATLLDAPDLRASLAAAARARVERLFGWEHAARRLIEVYEGLAPAPRGSARLTERASAS
jgi:glycosyltransferase involved in cell wall biosynthesis